MFTADKFVEETNNVDVYISLKYIHNYMKTGIKNNIIIFIVFF